MPRWLPRILLRIRKLVAEDRVLFTDKADEELAVLQIDQEDAIEVIVDLAVGDFVARLLSGGMEEWLYVFKPSLGGSQLYVKLAIRESCVVISFHEEENHEDEEVEKS